MRFCTVVAPETSSGAAVLCCTKAAASATSPIIMVFMVFPPGTGLCAIPRFAAGFLSILDRSQQKFSVGISTIPFIDALHDAFRDARRRPHAVHAAGLDRHLGHPEYHAALLVLRERIAPGSLDLAQPARAVAAHPGQDRGRGAAGDAA